MTLGDGAKRNATELRDLVSSFALEGTNKAIVGAVTKIGDFNQDGFDDYIVHGNSPTADAFLFYGPLDRNRLYRIESDSDTNSTVPALAGNLRIQGSDWSYEVPIQHEPDADHLREQYSVYGQSDVILSSAGVVAHRTLRDGTVVSIGSEDSKCVLKTYRGAKNFAERTKGASSSKAIEGNPPFKSDKYEVHVLNFDADASGEILVLDRKPESVAGKVTVGFLYSSDLQLRATITANGQRDKKRMDSVTQLETMIGKLLLGHDVDVKAAKDSFVAVVPGDVDGDGKDDVLIGDSQFLLFDGVSEKHVGRVHLLRGGTGGNSIELADSTVVWEGLGFGENVFAIGDVNLDGLADFGFTRSFENCTDNDLEGKGSIFLVHGSATFAEPKYFSMNKNSLSGKAQWPDMQGSSVFCVVRDRRRPMEPISTKDYFRNGELQVTSGDLNHDGHVDLVVSTSGNTFSKTVAAGQNFGTHHDKLLFLDAIATNRRPTTSKDFVVPRRYLDEATDRLELRTTDVGYRLSPYPLADLDDDGVVDLVVGDLTAKTTIAAGAKNDPVGAVHFILGENRTRESPRFGVDTLANRDVPGLGLFVVYPPSNRPFTHQMELGFRQPTSIEAVAVDSPQVWKYDSASRLLTAEAIRGRHVALLKDSHRSSFFEAGVQFQPSLPLSQSVPQSAHIVLNYFAFGAHPKPLDEKDCQSTSVCLCNEPTLIKDFDRFLVAGFDLATQSFEIKNESGLICPTVRMDELLLPNDRRIELRVRADDQFIELYARPIDLVDLHGKPLPDPDFGAPKLRFENLHFVNRLEINATLLRKFEDAANGGKSLAFADYEGWFAPSEHKPREWPKEFHVFRTEQPQRYRVEFENTPFKFFVQIGKTSTGQDNIFVYVDNGLNPSLTSGQAGLLVDFKEQKVEAKNAKDAKETKCVPLSVRLKGFFIRDTDAWLKFSTLGDGSPGTQISVNVDNYFKPSAEREVLPSYSLSKPLERSTYSTVAPTSLSQRQLHLRSTGKSVRKAGGPIPHDDPQPYHVGGKDEQALTFLAFDLTPLRTHVEAIEEELKDAHLHFCYRTSTKGKLFLRCLNEEAPVDLNFDADDLVEKIKAPNRVWLFPEVPVTKDGFPAGADIVFNADKDEIDLPIGAILKNALRSGRNRPIFMLRAEGFEQPMTFADFNDKPETFLKLEAHTNHRRGLRFDLFDKDLRQLENGSTIADMRRLRAGQYFMHVYDPFGIDDQPTWERSLPFEIEISPPRVGDSHAPSDRDCIHGQMGHDLLVGNGFADQLHGGDGIDQYVAERMEVRSNLYLTVLPAEFDVPPMPDVPAINEKILKPNLWDITSKDNSPLSMDKVIFKQSAPGTLGERVAEVLGLTRLEKSTVRLTRDIYARDISKLWSLDLSNQNVDDIGPLEFARNIQYLSLAGTQVTNLAPLQPGIHSRGAENNTRFGELGTRRIRYLDIDEVLIAKSALNLADGSPLLPFQAIASQWDLLYLSADLSKEQGAGVTPADLFAQSSDSNSWTKLRFLSAASRGVQSLKGLPLTVKQAAPLEFVNLRGNKVTDIEGLSNVPSLRWLEIDSEGLQTLQANKQLTG